MVAKRTISADPKEMAGLLQFVTEHMTKYGIREKEQKRVILATEEAFGCLLEHTGEGDKISVRIRAFFGYFRVEMTAGGERFSLADHMGDADSFDEEVGNAAQDMIRAILLKSMENLVKYRHFHGSNRISITAQRSRKAALVRTLGAMALAIVAGLILSELGYKEFNSVLYTYVLVPVKTMYMSALKMVVAPVVFFSIVSCIVRFTDISELGRVGGRVLSLYFLTTCIAVAVGIGSFYLFKPGSALPTEAAIQSAKEITSQTMNVSIKDTIVNIVPSDFMQPFVESNMLQLIFLALICGIATGLIGRSSAFVKQLFESFNDLFLKITTIIIRFMPIAIFASICSMMINMGSNSILSLIGIFATFLFGLVCMMLVYCILMLIVGKMNPLPFLKKYPASMLQVFSMASSNASIPINLEACEKLGIARKIYSLSIPLGATVNMDGACVYMAVFSFALAKTYGVHLTGASLMA
ncbi:MAG: cation:dicarboxylase symporter family transporter, partial [Parasporobacterium sp.]|nr:cation:dicarboxylase symporter family transporter [Parasporobacterium sp.]